MRQSTGLIIGGAAALGLLLLLTGKGKAAPTPPTIPTVEQFQAATTFAELTRLHDLAVRAKDDRRITYDQYLVLYDAYFTRWYEL